MKSRTSKGERTKQMIIEKAAPVFNERGYFGTSITDITKATQLTSGALYGSFANKEDIAADAFDYNVAKLFSGYYRRVMAKTTIPSKLFYVLDFPSTSLYPMFQGGCPVLNAAIEADDTIPWLRKKVNAALAHLIKLFKDLLDEGIENKEIEPLDSEKYSLFLISTIEGSIMMAKSMNDISIIRNATEHLKNDLKNKCII